MKTLPLVALGLVWFFSPPSWAEEKPTKESPAGEDLRLVGMAAWGKRFTLFVAWEDGPVRQLEVIGALIGPYKLAALDIAQGFADFEREPGKLRRVQLPESAVKAGAGGRIAIPPLESLKGLIGLDEAITRGGRTRVEQHLDFQFNQLQSQTPWEERVRKMADLIEGKTKNIMVPLGGIDEAFARKYNLTPREVENANWGEEVGLELAKTEKQRKENEKKRGSTGP